MSKLSTLDNPLERISGNDVSKENPFVLKEEDVTDEDKIVEEEKHQEDITSFFENENEQE